MTFVFPILLGGLALLAVPVLIHLIFRQKPKLLRFPAFRFLVNRRKTNVRKLRLRHLLLLFMRMALLALICLALARPKIAGDLLNLQTDRPVAVVMLFDTSMSMQYKTTGDQTRLEDAQQRAVKLLNTLHKDSRVAVLDTAESTVAGKGVWLKRDNAIARINLLALRFDSAPVTTRLEDAYRLFYKLAMSNDEIGRRLPRFLCVFSDGMESSWEASQLPQLYASLDTIPPSVERLKMVTSKVPARVKKLEQLRGQLPPPPGQDYPQQALIQHWQTLREKAELVTWNDYPDKKWITLLSQVRGRSRDLLKQLHSQNAEELPKKETDYRKELIQSLENGLQDLQGIYSLFIDVGVKKPVDLALLSAKFVGMKNDQQVYSQSDKVNIQVMVQATGSDFENSVICELNGEEIQRRTVQVSEGQAKPIQFTIDCSGLQPKTHHLRFHTSGTDQLPFTNQRFATFAIRPPRQILIATDDVETASFWATMIERNPRVRFHCTLKTTEQAAQMSPKDLANFHAVYLFNIASPPLSLWKSVERYVQEGGNVCVVPPGRNLDADAYGNKTTQAILPGTFERVVEADPGAVWNWDDAFVYFPQFRQWKDLGRADFIDIPRRAFQYWEVKPVSKDFRSIRYAGSEKPAVLIRDFGKSKGLVVQMTTRLHTDAEDDAKPWNNYLKTTNSFFVVLPGELSIYLAGDLDEAQLNFISGKSAPYVVLPPGTGNVPLTLNGPGSSELVTPESDSNEILFRKVVEPGGYTLDSPDGPIGGFSVNLPAEEGMLKRVPLMEIESLFGRGATVALKQGETLEDKLQDRVSTPEEMLPVLLIALLVFLALENLLANLFYKRQPAPEEA